jgi:hypothetical protein
MENKREICIIGVLPDRLMVGHVPLKILENSVEEVDKRDMAYLDDKIEVVEKESQVYGTQLIFNVEKDTYEVMDLRDAETVNERRSSLGLETLEDYITFANRRRKEMIDNQAK